MSKNATVYTSRARSTGALCETIDTRHPEASKVDLFRKRTKAEEGMRYAARCVDHKQVVFFQEHYPAGRAIAWPQEWCSKCKTLFEAGNKVKAPDKAQATNGKAPAKVTPQPAAKAKAPRKTTARKATPKPAPVAETSDEPVVDGDEPASTEELEELAATLAGN